ncbi:hypothetical protein JZO78_03815 [Enterococcus ureilyticus]|uniref:hypothetical protein n=1 Tax=Enterococcus ureilyticus TaxID=1131292 RepID=UPI001A91DC61|nr:hypothetical protein [Enterococcus ureilyticus]MBO0445462.1 hypothetical protein [Enterococcus ureilyticus]
MQKLDDLTQAILESLPRLKTNSDYWLVRTESGSYYDDFNSGSFIAIGWNAIDQKIMEKNKDNPSQLKVQVESLYKDDKQPGRTANQLISFMNDIKIGDLVLIPSESSERYMLGEVTSDLYFEQETDVVSSPEKCPYTKRRKVKWIKSFSKRDADSKILKLSYRQQTVNDINEYKTFINRALYGAYIDDDDLLHLTYDINIDENINMVDLSSFLYNYTQMYELLTQNKDIEIKINAQSKGKSEIITKTAAGIAIAVLIYGATTLPYGGEVKIGGGLLPEISVKSNGVIPQNEKIKNDNKEIKLKEDSAKRENTAKDIENVEKAMKLAEELDVPVESLNLGIPQEIIDAINSAKEKETADKSNP